jgi:mercuric ion binding protein
MLYGVIAGVAGLSLAGAFAIGEMCSPEMMNDPAMRERMESQMPMMMRGMGGTMGGMRMSMEGMTEEASSQALPAEANKVATITVEGMTCGGCAIGVRTALGRLDGVAKAEVSYEEQRAVVTFDPAKVSTDQILRTIGEFGYTATLVEVKDKA